MHKLKCLRSAHSRQRLRLGVGVDIARGQSVLSYKLCDSRAMGIGHSATTRLVYLLGSLEKTLAELDKTLVYLRGLAKPDGGIYGSLTTPDPVTLHKTLAELANEGVTHLALEASSHGLDQHRLYGVRIAAGGFTFFGLRLQEPRHLKLLNAFTGGYLITLTMLHLLPELYHDADDAHAHRLDAARGTDRSRRLRHHTGGGYWQHQPARLLVEHARRRADG